MPAEHDKNGSGFDGSVAELGDTVMIMYPERKTLELIRTTIGCTEFAMFPFSPALDLIPGLNRGASDDADRSSHLVILGFSHSGAPISLWDGLHETEVMCNPPSPKAHNQYIHATVTIPATTAILQLLHCPNCIHIKSISRHSPMESPLTQTHNKTPACPETQETLTCTQF